MQKHIVSSQANGYEILLNFFKKLEINHFFGITGGGVIHFLKSLHAYPHQEPSLFTIDEYSAGFSSLGYYLASRKLSASVATLGAATKLLTCGFSDAKLHDIPSIYIVPSYDKDLDGKASLQDSSKFGSNIIQQLKAECPKNVFVLNHQDDIYEQLIQAELALKNNKPIFLVLVHTALSQSINKKIDQLSLSKKTYKDKKLQNSFLSAFIQSIKNKRVTILVGEEMNSYGNAKDLIQNLSYKLKSYVIWSMNGANAVKRNNIYGYGYLGFGGNDLANEHFNELNSDDVLLILGACPDEYTVNLNDFTSGHIFYCTHIENAYGQINGSLKHRSKGKYYQLNGPLDLFIESFLNDESTLDNVEAFPAPPTLNTRSILAPEKGFTHMEYFYQQLDQWWPNNSIAFSDVCLAYKDRQYVTQRPNDNIEFYSLYRGSAMGYVLGAAVGAKISDPSKNVFAFTGDGCFKLFAGSLAEASDLGITLFVLNNSKFSIVDQGLQTILSDTPEEHWHSEVKPINYCMLAHACGWRSIKLNTDLSNLEEILNSTLINKKSLLVEIIVDPNQILGINPRVNNL